MLRDGFDILLPKVTWYFLIFTISIKITDDYEGA